MAQRIQRRTDDYVRVVVKYRTSNGVTEHSVTSVEENNGEIIINLDIEALAKALGARVGVSGIDQGALATEIEGLGLLTSEKLTAAFESYSNGAGGLDCGGSEVTLDAKAMGDLAEEITKRLVSDLEDTPYIKGLLKASDLNSIKNDVTMAKVATENAVNGLSKVVTDGLNSINVKLQSQGETDLKKVRDAVKSELSDQSNNFMAIQTATKKGVANYFEENKSSNSFAKAIATSIVEKDNTLATRIATQTAKECVTSENTGRERLSLFFGSLVLSIMAVMFTFLAVTLNQNLIIWCFVLTTISLLISFFTGITVYLTETRNGMQKPLAPSVSWGGAVVNIGIAVALLVTVIVALATHS